jgi:flagellin
MAKVTGAAITTPQAFASGDITINGQNIGAVAAGGDPATQAANVAAAINSFSGTTNVYASIVNGNQIVLSNSTGGNVVVAGAATAPNLLAGAGLVAGTTAATTTTGFGTLNLNNVAGADAAMTQMDAALQAVNTARANLGAIQNRFSSTVANLQTASENLSASRSRIQDADFASETANLTRAEILQQAGTAMLAQANSLPQNVLTLLKG